MVAYTLSDDEVDRLFRALADRTRRDIVRRTLTAEASISELAKEYDMTFAAVQKHVAVLEAADLVARTARGRERIILANPEAIKRAQQLLGQLETIWRASTGSMHSSPKTCPPRAPRPPTRKATLMPITSVDTDAQALTISVVADFTVSVRRLWDAYLDPRQLESSWGPPTYPATFTRHDGYVGGLSNYYMIKPEATPLRLLEVGRNDEGVRSRCTTASQTPGRVPDNR